MLSDERLRKMSQNFHITYGPLLLSYIDKGKPIEAYFIARDDLGWFGAGNLKLVRNPAFRSFGREHFVYAHARTQIEPRENAFSLGYSKYEFNHPIWIETDPREGISVLFVKYSLGLSGDRRFKFNIDVPKVLKALREHTLSAPHYCFKDFEEEEVCT